MDYRALTVTVTILGSLAGSNAFPQTPSAVVSLGRCELQNGQVLIDCRLSYRAFGRLSAARDNAVLIPTWLGGRSEDWIRLLGTNGLVDTSGMFVVVVDAFGNGASSSPSNTPDQTGDTFPAITITDMVQSQYRLLTEQLGILRLHAVVGISMGGMQAYEWAVRYPAFVDRIVPIVGSPRLGAYDRLLWSALLATVENGRRYGVPQDSIWEQFARIRYLVQSTPQSVNGIGADRIDSALTASARQASRLRFDDWALQTRAMLAHDAYRASPLDSAGAIRNLGSRMLVVYSWDDHVVTAGPSAEFARLAGADTLVVSSACGHGAFFCELDRIGARVRQFLAR